MRQLVIRCSSQREQAFVVVRSEYLSIYISSCRTVSTETYEDWYIKMHVVQHAYADNIEILHTAEIAVKKF